MRISVCIATYNGEKYIYAQLESILKQLSWDDEVVISDDSSIDKTVDIIRSFRDKRIRLIESDRARSPVYNFENGLKLVRGDIIVLSDQDNIWPANRVNIIRKHFSRKKSAINTLVMDGVIIDERGNVLSTSILEEIRFRKGIIKNLVRNTYMGCAMAFSRDLLEVALPFPKNLPMHDIWLGILSEIHGEVDLCREKTLEFRIHSLNASLKDLADISHLKRIRWRFFLVVNLLQRYLLVHRK